METPHPKRRFGRRQLLVSAGATAALTGCSVIADEAATLVGDNNTSAFGGPINLGPVADVVAAIRENDGFWYRPDGRTWVVEYPAEAMDRARPTYSAPELTGMEVGIVALLQKCPHLGCRVPSCTTSQWFECPCHGSKYNQVGEKRGGPAPRGMDRFAIELTNDGDVIALTSIVIQGPPIGTNTTGQQAAGPNCIGEASG